MKQFSAERYNEDYFAQYNRVGYDVAHEMPFKARIANYIQRVYRPRTVLDIGCAAGVLVQELRRRGISAHGVEISSAAIQMAPESVKPYLRCADVRDGLPYDTGEFDLVVSDAVFEHIDEEYILPVFKEVYRVCKETFYLRIPVGLTYRNTPVGDPTHVTYYPPAYWISVGWQAGFICDIRRSEQYSEDGLLFNNANLSFSKNGLVPRQIPCRHDEMGA